jgi:hypothetical protein
MLRPGVTVESIWQSGHFPLSDYAFGTAHHPPSGKVS